MGRLILTLLFAGLAAPAAAQCLAIPDGTGNSAIHCADGRIGHLHDEGAGVSSGMLGGQTFIAPSAVVAPGLAAVAPAPSYLNPDIARETDPVPPPTLAAPPIKAGKGELPAPTPPDPADADDPDEAE